MILHGYFRSTASYRVRIALNLKSIAYDDVFVHLRKGEQRSPEFLALNPQGFLPALDIGEAVLTQSLAICEYLDEQFPEPTLLPGDAIHRAKLRAFSQVIACDIHPVQNLRILARLRNLGMAEDVVSNWAAELITEGLEACSRLIANESGPYCFGDQVTLADICLVPQMVNARRFGAKFDWPRLQEIEEACLKLPAFAKAAPEAQPDAE